MDSLQLRRYEIALSRGFKGNFRDFCKTNRVSEFKERPKSNPRKPHHLEEHVLAVIESTPHVDL